MRRTLQACRTATTLAFAAACSDSAPTGNPNNPGNQPDTGTPGIQIVAGNTVTDTVGARPVQALTVIVRQPDGTRAIGVTVRFQSLTAPPPRQFAYPVLVAALSSPSFQTFMADTTDNTGAASVVIGFSTFVSPGGVQITVPTLGFADTARYTVTVGNVARVIATPADTQVSLGGTVQVQVSTQDAYGNPRQDAIVYSALDPGVSVNATGLATATGSGVGRVVTRVGTVADTVTVGVVPSGTLAAYRSQASPEGIVSIGMTGTSPTLLAPAVVTDWPATSTWNSAGTHVVFASADRLYFVAATGGTVTRLINPGVAGMTQELMPQIARSAGTVFFTAGFGTATLSIWRTDADGSNPTQILTDAAHSYRQPAPSPDGTRVAVIQDNNLLRVLDVGSHTLSSWSLTGISPQWSPVGDQIVYYVAGRVRIVNADGTGDHQISPTTHSYNPWVFSWSPDAHWVISHTESPSGLELLDATTGGAIVIKGTGNYFYPTWKP